VIAFNHLALDVFELLLNHLALSTHQQSSAASSNLKVLHLGKLMEQFRKIA